jgi:transcriptional antiterminator NusG
MIAMTEETINHVYAIKTTSKQERTVADKIKNAIDTNATDIKVLSFIVPDELQVRPCRIPEKLNRIEQLGR